MAEIVKKFRRELINRCSEPLIKGLLDDLLHEDILGPDEVEHINQCNLNRANKCRDLIDIVINKGNYSCNVLLQRITQRDRILSEDIGITAALPLPTQEAIPPAPEEPPLTKQEKSSQQEINGITPSSHEEFVEIMNKEKDIYPIRQKGNRKRLALIICNIKFNDKTITERKGANFDIDGMGELLKGFDYDVQFETNLTAEEMKATMKTFAARSDHKDSDSTFLVFMSHGERNIIYGTDFKREYIEGQERLTGDVHVDAIHDTFNNLNCPGLRDKPKIILIQACRGHNKSRQLVSDSSQPSPSKQEDLEDDGMRMILKETDLICFYSTTPDTLSYRDTLKGTFFIQRVIDIMKKDAHNSSIEDIFRKVQLSFKDDWQMPTQDRKTLLKKFFLFPGY
ncbi:caspase-1-B-like isoform X3 [Bufo gargarizans]|uniref:caspase-1-B-like isoform X3 n=1 Tax=Bufo gargarizans TaxID=30331 RepID=UPI001CF2A36B|nr:caspase-1-B-like isoform X3 [Bufo gargarizans]